MRIVLADDHVLFLDAVESYLKILQPEIDICKATNFDEALRKAEDMEALDLVILDLNMPGMHGFDGLKVMKEKLPEVPVVLLSGQAGACQVRKGLSLGARGFIAKDLDARSMLRALELVLSGETYVPMVAISEDAAAAESEGVKHYSPDNPLSQLTPRQIEVLTLLARGYANKEISRELDIKVVTVAVHLQNIFRKLDVSGRTKAISKSYKLGLEVD